MIVSSSSHLHHRVVVGGMDERRATSRCSLELLGVSSSSPDAASTSAAGAAASSSSKMMTSSSVVTVPSPHHTHYRIPPLGALTLSAASTSTEEEDDDLSSPASSGYGRSTTSESEELQQSAVRFSSRPAAAAAQSSSGGGRRAAGGADGGGGGEWDVMNMPRHPFLTAIGRFLPVDDIEDLGSLGEGFFSVVDKVRIRSTGEILVRKVAKPGVRGERRETHADVAREAKMLRRLEHDNVLALRGMSIVQSDIGEWDLHLFLDYCEGGSLSRLLLDHSIALPWRHRFSYAVDIARGMAHIHSRRVIHRDLTSMNVLIQYSPSFPSCGRAVIADFGLSCDFPREGEKLSQVGTTYFMSPECLKEQHYDEKSDVYSFGIILCQLIARIDADPDTGLHRTAHFGINYRLFISYCPTDTRMEMLQVAFGCCLMDPFYRPAFSDALSQLERVLVTMNKQAAAQATVYPEDISPGRLERSRSDAALRRPRAAAVHTRKYSAYHHRPTVKPVTEGLAEEATALDAEYIDRLPSPTMMQSAAAAAASTTSTTASSSPTGRPQLLQGAPLSMLVTPKRSQTAASPMNPFMSHARFRSTRKILPPREEERDRRASERQREEEEEEEMDGGGGRRRKGRMMRRCSSLPSEMDSPSLDWASSDEYTDDDDDVYEGEGSGGGGGTTTVDTLAKVFTEWDQKFLRQSRRFSTRRNTIMGAGSAVASSSMVTPTVPPTPTVTGATPTTSAMTSSQSTSALAASTTAAMMHPPTVLSLTVSPGSDSSATPSSISYSPATGDRLNNNGCVVSPSPTVSGESAGGRMPAIVESELGTTAMPTKYSSWPKRRESRIVRQEDAAFASGICRSRTAPRGAGARSTCSIL
ncbi:hypothetical protein PFISCL1PPCAC_4685 [Pristionchus fissidentatus]|uniref:Protein kinase domain-containing protein n=1 Tax=Pristionchus fissidentatus TaxID=1538716 RepID=A0AAV5V4V2_9BILA|nr:hypothetical protein PFISCL1PPCAC_4685 [Pristionchus fissidentatus]